MNIIKTKNITPFSLSYSVYSINNSIVKLNVVNTRKGFFHSRGLTMPMSRSPPFLSKNKKTKKEWRNHK